MLTLPDNDVVEWVGPGCDKLLPNCTNTFNIIIISQGSLEGNASVLIGSLLVGILPYGPFPWTSV